MWCVYGHYTTDTNELFYIGKGRIKRAYSKQNRSLYWKRVANKHGIRVEIFMDNLDEATAFIQEILAIKEFSPRCNFTMGGEGPSGFKQDPEQVLKRVPRGERHHRWGKTVSDEIKRKISETKKKAALKTKCKSVFCTSTKKIWPTIKECAKELGIKRTTLNAYLRGQSPNITTIQYCTGVTHE